jgi:hypothetical protein
VLRATSRCDVKPAPRHEALPPNSRRPR